MRIYPGGLAQGVVLACGCSAARAGPCGDPSAPTASRDTRRFQIAIRETSCTAAGTRHRQIVSAVWRVPLCAGVGVHHLVSGPHAQAHAPAQVYPPRVGACIPPSLCTPRPPSAETQINLRLLGSYIDRGDRCHQSSFVAMFRLYRVSAFRDVYSCMRFD